MKFRPCIDIHNGKVKQIIGGSLKDAGDQVKENFVAEQDAAFYAKLYKKAGLKGGHVILLNSVGSEYYGATRAQAMKALIRRDCRLAVVCVRTMQQTILKREQAM